MTVAELIQELLKHAPSLKVCIFERIEKLFNYPHYSDDE